MKTPLVLLLIIATLATTSCNHIIAKLYGVKKPKPRTDIEVLSYIRAQGCGFDYIIRPRNDSETIAITKYMHMAFNGLVLYDSSGNEIATTNDSTCHYGLRSQITEIVKRDSYEKPLHQRQAKSVLTQFSNCLNCTMGQQLFTSARKKYMLFFSYAQFIPFKKKLSDIDYVDELKAAGIRDKVTLVLINTDLH